jgi:hypothetical protein
VRVDQPVDRRRRLVQIADMCARIRDMSDSVEITPAIHRQIGIATFNETWSLFESDPADALLHTAHTSAYHWRPVAEPVNLVRSDWLLARAYTVKGWSEPALYYAQRALRLCEENGIGDFDLAYAYEGMARAHALAEIGRAHV